MKFMRLGTRPDNFYTEEAIRFATPFLYENTLLTILSDLPSDLTICVNNITYLLHRFPLVPKCGLLQRLCSDRGDCSRFALELHDIPGGEGAFELCAKFCYGITIDLSAHNFVPAICAAKFLQMTDSVEKGNFVSKLEAFFNSCILEGWKDSIVTLQTTVMLPEWSENLGIIRRCIDSIVEKVLTPPTKVRWSYTYTREGYAQKKHHQSAPKDWWTEDIANLDIDLFRCIINTVKLTNMLPPQLIGEALHVYSCIWLPDLTSGRPNPETSTASQMSKQESVNKKGQLETIISMIPEDKGSVSVGFLLRLLSLANLLGASPVIKTQLIKRCSLQLEDATPNDLLLLSSDSCDDKDHIHDIALVKAVVESFIMRWRRQPNSSEDLIRKVGELTDSYLKMVARDANMPVQKLVSLAKTLPEFARPQHDNLYKAINIYLKEHPGTSKEEKKQLCSIIDCQKLSPGVCAHAVKNEKLPLRMVVQVLFFDQERSGSKTTVGHDFEQLKTRNIQSETQSSKAKDELKNKLVLGSGEESSGGRSKTPDTTRQTLEQESKHKSRRKKVVEMGFKKERETMDPRKTGIQRSRSHDGHNNNKGRER
ncbi:hypothetical protein Ccrd_026670 [Cynara cardunculus var. scolymus]|uniref:NPH3 domain-containing protein n=1 Tax=Cynara cardunculus var. scolymus TaxID=59895 RepID=A0A103XD16_CYNCS|nr:hypothetical protein Ccrd_026670 [Cynara cardunculus var. scolymus]